MARCNICQMTDIINILRDGETPPLDCLPIGCKRLLLLLLLLLQLGSEPSGSRLCAAEHLRNSLASELAGWLAGVFKRSRMGFESI